MNKCEEGIVISRGTFRDFAIASMDESMKDVLEHSNDVYLNMLFAMKFSILIGKLEVQIFGEEKE